MKDPFGKPGFYAIHVAGRVDSAWLRELAGLTVAYQEEDDGGTVSILKGYLPDQAALLGLIHTLYDARYPLLFVSYLRAAPE